MGRQFLNPIQDRSVEEIVRRLCGVQAQVASSAELAVRVRQQTSQSGDVARALADGRLIKTWAMRGTLHLFTPEDAGAFLSLMAAGRSWERPIWERYFGVSPAQIEKLRTIIRDVLGDRALTREEIGLEVTARPGFEHLGEALKSGWGTLLKPLAWQGDIVFGPSRGTRVTFMRPEVASRTWAGLPGLDEAWPRAIRAYLGAYGPATIDNFSAWLSRGSIPKRKLRTWFADLGDELTEVDLEGEPRFIRSDDVESLASSQPTSGVRLLPGFDQWVLGPGTDDPNVVPVAQRSAVSRQAGWIAPVVLVGPVVSGTWEIAKGQVVISWFPRVRKPPKRALDAELHRLSTILGGPA
jgi:hypothetical protein